MSEKKHHVASLYERSPAVAGLNQIQGFDPCKLLRRTVSRTGREEVLNWIFVIKSCGSGWLIPREG